MARPVSIPDEQILEHARAVFLERGLKATTAEVARRAGVSEGLLFKRWGSKRGLFEHAMVNEESFGPHDWLQGLEGRIGQGELRDHLIELGVHGIAFMRKLMPLITMSHSHLGEDHVVHRGEGGPFESRTRLERYFEAERALGRIRHDVDSTAVARTFLGTLFSYASWEMMLGAHDPKPLAPETFVQGMVDVLWRGLTPPPE